MTLIPEESVQEYPLLPLRDVVVFPHMVVPLFVGREKSIQALEAAMEGNKEILLVAQRDASTDEPGPDDVFAMGTVATVLQMLIAGWHCQGPGGGQRPCNHYRHR